MLSLTTILLAAAGISNIGLALAQDCNYNEDTYDQYNSCLNELGPYATRTESSMVCTYWSRLSVCLDSWCPSSASEYSGQVSQCATVEGFTAGAEPTAEATATSSSNEAEETGDDFGAATTGASAGTPTADATESARSAAATTNAAAVVQAGGLLGAAAMAVGVLAL